MAKKLSPWLKNEVIQEFSGALRWRQDDLVRSEGVKVKRESEEDDLSSSDDEDEKYGCNGSCIEISLTRPTNANSRLQIIKVCVALAIMIATTDVIAV